MSRVLSIEEFKRGKYKILSAVSSFDFFQQKFYFLRTDFQPAQNLKRGNG